MSDWQRIEATGGCCPVCRKDTWCLITNDAVICGRVRLCTRSTCRYCREGRPRKGGDGGYLHLVRLEQHRSCYRSRLYRFVDSTVFDELNRTYQNKIEPGQIDWLSGALGVGTESLHRLELGWIDQLRAFSFPIRRPTGQIVGIATRPVNGPKRAVVGSASGQGLFVPQGIDPDRALFVAEGASDTAAILTLGLNAIGRVSAGTDSRLVREFVIQRGFTHVIAVADRDEVGQKAAVRLANYLRPFRCTPYLLIPPVKDIRQWLQAGATPADIRKEVVRV